MSAKTKLVVLHMKELVYTGIFLALGIVFILLLCIMFRSDNSTESTNTTSETYENTYIPGIYTTSLVLNDQTVDVAVTVDEHYISNVELKHLDETITTMYPLIQPSLESIAKQLYDTQSLDAITYTEENKYTSLVLINAIRQALESAKVTLDL